jgi:hypothetical protein
MAIHIGIPENESAHARTKRHRHVVRTERLAARREKAAAGERAVRLCSLETVEVKKGREDLQIVVDNSDGRWFVFVTTRDAGPVLRDLETAIKVIRGQQ